MKNVLNWAVSAALALGLTAGLMAVSAHAKDKGEGKKDGNGSITGKVVDKDGNAVAGAEVVLVKAPARGEGKQKKDGAALKAEKKVKNQADDDAATEKKKPEPVATATTDSDGKFAFKDIAAGDYAVRTRMKGAGAANARVTVASGATAEVKLQLAQGGKKEPGAKKTPAEKKEAKQAKKAKQV